MNNRIDRAKAIREERECSVQEAVAFERLEFLEAHGPKSCAHCEAATEISWIYCAMCGRKLDGDSPSSKEIAP